MSHDCKICNAVYNNQISLESHIRNTHEMKIVDYMEKYFGRVPLVCEICGEKCLTKVVLSIHKKKIHNIIPQRDLDEARRANREKTIKCEECGEMFSKYNELSSHLKKKHNMTAIEYYKKYLMKPTDFENCKECGKPNNFRFDRGFNDFCCFSCSTTWYAKNTNRVEMAQETMKKRKEEDPDFHLSTSSARYWILKGFSEEEAKQKVIERQRTFTKEKLVEKLGEEEGLKRWKERQEKWQDTLKAKSPEERERIARAKMCDGRGYSKISQELFDEITKRLPSDLKVYYATHRNADQSHLDFVEHYEYMLYTVNERHVFLDFYIPCLFYCLEFDGDYWHGEERGNKERDLLREQEIKNTSPKIIIDRVQEKDYMKNKTEITNKYVKIIYDLIERENNAFRSS
jgi:hypothetical protein